MTGRHLQAGALLVWLSLWLSATAAQVNVQGGARADNSWLYGLPTGRVEACPSDLSGDKATALIAANHDARAIVRFRGSPDMPAWVNVDLLDEHGRFDKRPDPALSFVVAVPDPKRARQHETADYTPVARGKPFRTRTDRSGELKLIVKLRIPTYERQPQPLQRPLVARVSIMEHIDEHTPKDAMPVSGFATLRIGLGIEVDHANLIPVSLKLGDGPNHVWRATVRSRFHQLDVASYAAQFPACDPELPRPVVNIQSMRQDSSSGADAPLLDGIGGPPDDVAPGGDGRISMGFHFELGLDPQGATYLKPRTLGARQPHRYYGGQVYPGVTHLREGHYSKGYFAFLRVEEPAHANNPNPARITYNQPSLEPHVMRGTTYGFSLDDPERWYTSLLCALEARTVDQMFVLSALTLLPTAGDGLGLSLGVLGALCEGARGNYRESFARLRDAIGELAFQKLVKDGIIAQATQGQWSPSFYRYLGIDPASMSAEESKAFADGLSIAYDLVAKNVKASSWQPPPAAGGTAQREGSWTSSARDEELAAAQREFDEAYRAYTTLVTQDVRGDVTAALARYKAAAARLAALKGK